MKLLRVGFSICVVAFVTGCPKYDPTVDFKKPGSFVSKLNEHIKTEQLQYNCYRIGKDLETGATTCSTKTIADGPTRARVTRNELVEEALPFIDDAYASFINNIEAGRSRANFVADVVELGTSAAIGFTNGQRPIKIMGIALTAFRGSRRSADINFYKEQTTQILINKMDDNRARVREAILTKEKNDINAYPIGDAIRDIVAYYNAGTLIRAFTELSKDTAAQAQVSEDKVRKLTGVPMLRPATKSEAEAAGGAREVLDKLRDSLKDGGPEQKKEATRHLQNLVEALAKDPQIRDILTGAGLIPQIDDGSKILATLDDIATKLTIKGNMDALDRMNQIIAKP